MTPRKKANARVTNGSRSHFVTIEATFGSDRQRTVAVKVLKGLLAAWKASVEFHHEKNAVTIIHKH